MRNTPGVNGWVVRPLKYLPCPSSDWLNSSSAPSPLRWSEALKHRVQKHFYFLDSNVVLDASSCRLRHCRLFFFLVLVFLVLKFLPPNVLVSFNALRPDLFFGRILHSTNPYHAKRRSLVTMLNFNYVSTVQLTRKPPSLTPLSFASSVCAIWAPSADFAPTSRTRTGTTILVRWLFRLPTRNRDIRCSPSDRYRLSWILVLVRLSTTRLAVSEALADDPGEISDCDLRVLQVRMPKLLPLETVEALVSHRPQGFDLAPNGNISLPGQNIFAVFTITGRVFQVCMSYPASQLLDRKLRFFV
jgi:hypothetical protein